MSEPTSYPEWATSPLAEDIEEPDAAKKESGWTLDGGVPEKPKRQYFNWWMNCAYSWIKHFKEEAASFSGMKTFDNNITSDTVSEASTDAGVLSDATVRFKDGSIVLNVGNGVSSAGGYEVSIEENNVVTGKLEVTSDRETITFDVPSGAGIGYLRAGSTGLFHGFFPLGSIVALANSQAWSAPGADVMKDGWALCNGNTFAALGAGNYNASFTGNRPNISDSRFLMGYTSAGSTGGATANSVTISSANIPTTSFVAADTHTHSVASVASPLSSGGQSADHTHTASSNGAHSHTGIAGTYGTSTIDSIKDDGTNDGDFAGGVTTSGGAHTHTTGFETADHTHTFSGNTGNQTSDHTHAVGNSSPSSYSKLPLYFSVIYLIRVK